jgi:cysteine desulfurase
MSWVHSSFKPEPLLTGGDQEYGKRAGTENLSGILGLAKAIELLSTELPAATERMRKLRDMLETELQKKLGPVHVNGTGPRTSNCSNLAFAGADGEELLMKLDLAGIAVSHGSACSSGALEPSRVLTHMGVPQALARASLRFSLSRLTTEEEIRHTVRILCSFV